MSSDNYSDEFSEHFGEKHFILSQVGVDGALKICTFIGQPVLICCFFIALLWSPYVIGQPLYFCPVISIFYLLFFPRLISAATDWMSTILLHMAWP